LMGLCLWWIKVIIINFVILWFIFFYEVKFGGFQFRKPFTSSHFGLCSPMSRYMGGSGSSPKLGMWHIVRTTNTPIWYIKNVDLSTTSNEWLCVCVCVCVCDEGMRQYQRRVDCSTIRDISFQ
jgi:hypothetical protein